MKKTLLAVIIGSLSAASFAEPVSVGGKVFHSSDTDENTLTRYTTSAWIAGDVIKPRVLYRAKLKDFYNKGDSDISTTESRQGTALVRVTTVVKDEPAGVFAELEAPISLKNKSVRFKVLVSDWKALSGFSLIFSSDGPAFTKTVTLDLTTHVINPTNNEWIEVVAPLSNWISDDQPDIEKLTTFLWKMQDNGTGRVTALIDSFEVVDNPAASVTITLDDGRASVLEAKKIMDKHKIVGSIYIDEAALGREGYLTEAQVDQIAKDGWEVGGHQVMNNLRASTVEEVAAHIEKTAQYLKNRKYKGASVFAYPNGINDPKVNAEVEKNFEAGLNIDGLSNTVGYVSPYRINRRSYDRFTTLDQIKKWIKESQAAGEWLVLTFHTVDANSTTDENISPADFDEICKFIAENKYLTDSTEAVFKKAEPGLKLATTLNVTQVEVSEQPVVTSTREFGVAYARTEYHNPTGTHHADAISALVNVKRDSYAVLGDVGIGEAPGKNFFFGDLNGYYFVNKNMSLTAGIDGDLVDSVEGLTKKITTVGAQLGVDVYNDIGGGSVAYRQSRFSDGNDKTGWLGKVYVNVVDGVNVYVKGSQYGNSMPNNGNYFSPDEYARYAVGVAFRKLYGDYLVTGFVDTGRQKVDGEKSNAHAWKLSLDKRVRKNWSWGVALGSDLSNGSNYQYYYADVHARYDFK